MSGMSEQICYENFYSSKAVMGRAVECLKKQYIEAVFHPWCINYKKMHKNYSSQMLQQAIKQNTMNFKNSKLKHTCTEQKSVQIENYLEDVSFLFSSLFTMFSQSSFWIDTLLVIPNNFARKVFSLNMVFSFLESLNWIDIVIQRKVLPTCPNESVNFITLHGTFNITRNQLQNHHISIPNEIFKKQNILLKVNVSGYFFKDISVFLTMHLKDDFKSIQGSDMNRNQKSTIETHIAFSNVNPSYLIYNHEKFKFIKMTAFEENSTAMLNIYKIQICPNKFHDISIGYTCFNFKDQCWHKCLKYVPKDIAKSFAFLYHPNIDELLISKTCLAGYFDRPFKCRFPNALFVDKCLKGSWMEAAEVCKEYGGHLPIIRSKEELDEIIGLFYLTKVPAPLMTVMFIGLINFANRVCFSYF